MRSLWLFGALLSYGNFATFADVMKLSIYKTNIVKAAIWALCILGYYVLFQSFYNMVAYKTVWPYESVEDFLPSFWNNLLSITITFLIIMAVVFLGPWKSLGRWKIAIDIVVTAVLMGAYNLCYLSIRGTWIDWGGTVFNAIFIILGLETVYWVRYTQCSIKRAEEYRRQMIQFEYDALKAQVNPHFLFNSLNILYSLIDLDREKTKEFTMALSQTYRYIMSQQGRTVVPLVDELKFLESYTKVLCIRYNDSLKVNIIGHDKAEGKQVIAYCLQLAMENVTKHNTILPEQPMTVTVEIGEDTVRICNPIRRKQSVIEGSGIGFAYMSKLYKDAGAEFTHREEDGIMTVTVPYV